MENFVLEYKSILSGIQQFTNFSRIYFSNQNIDWVQTNLRYRVYKESGDIIGKQDEKELVLIMRSVYLELSLNPTEVSEYSKNLISLNMSVITGLVPKLLVAINSHKRYQQDALNVRTPLARPKNTNVKGTHDPLGFSDALGINTF